MGTRNIQRITAPDSLAVFLRLKKGASSIVYDRVERRNKRPFNGNMPGATVYALVETRSPITNWKSTNTENIQEKPAMIGRDHSARNLPLLNALEGCRHA